VSVSGFPVSLFDCFAFSIPAFSVTPVLTRTNRVLEVARIYTKHSKCCDEFFVLTMSLYTFISLLYKQLLQYTMLKTFTVPSALLTKFAKKFHMKLLASDITFTKLSTKTLCFDAAVFHLSIKGYCKTRPRRSYCFLSMFKLRCKRYYRNPATYSWYNMTWTRHENCAGATPTFDRRRRRTALLLSRADARESADIIYRMWRMSLVCGSGIYSYRCHKGHAQNIYYEWIKLQCLINTNKSNLIHRL